MWPPLPEYDGDSANPHHITDLIADYRIAAIAAQEIEAPRLQNRWAARLHKAYKALRVDADGRAAIRLLMEDPSCHVRLWAAAHCLDWCPGEAQVELERLRDSDEFASFDARWVLIEHHRGALTFDY